MHILMNKLKDDFETCMEWKPKGQFNLQGDGYNVGFGTCEGKIVPSQPWRH